MKKFIRKPFVIFAICILACGFTFPSILQAQALNTSGQTTGGFNYGYNPNPAPPASGVLLANKNTPSTPTPSRSILGVASDFFFGITNLVVNGDTMVAIVSGLYTLLSVLTGLLTLCGVIFDVAMHFTIFDIGTFFSTTTALTTVWALVRDTFNIAFIFILLYIAASMILGTWGLKTKSTLTSVIVSALLINFSMFFTKVLIDFGNIFAVAIYNHMGPATTAGISSALLGILHLTDLLGILSVSGQMNIIATLVLENILAIMAMWVFGYGAFILIGRTTALILLAIVSPIGFVGGSIPWLKEYEGQWWSMLTDQILVAPLLLFLLYLAYTVLGSISIFANKTVVTILAPGFSNLGEYFYYFVAIMILIQGMKLVKKLSHGAGAMALKIVGAGVGIVAGAAVLPFAAGGALAASGGAAEAAAAEAANGGGRLAQLGARLAFNAKRIPTSLRSAPGGLKNFATGNYDKTGVKGFAQDILRENAIKGIKGATGGSVDVKAVEKFLKERNVSTEKALATKAESFTKEGEAKKKELEAKDAEIKKVAEENIPKSTEHTDAEKTHEANTKELEAAKAAPASKIVDTNGKPIANERLAKAQTAFDTSSAAVERFKTAQEEDLKKEKDKLAKEMGEESYEAIIGGIKAAEEAVRKGEGERRKFINELSQAKTGVDTFARFGILLGGSKQASEIANKLRSGKLKTGKSKKEQLADLAVEVQKEEDKAKESGTGNKEADNTAKK